MFDSNKICLNQTNIFLGAVYQQRSVDKILYIYLKLSLQIVCTSIYSFVLNQLSSDVIYMKKNLKMQWKVFE